MKLFFRKLGAGHPLIIIHGLYGASDNWMSIGRELSNYFEVYLIDQRNHGRSPHSDILTYDAMVDDLREFMDDHSLDKAILLGHSMGGKTAMFFAEKYPERISNLIVVDIAPVDYKKLTDYSQSAIDHLNIINAMASIDFSQIKTRTDADEFLSMQIPYKRIRQFLLKNLHRKKDGSFTWSVNIDALKNNLNKILDGFDDDKIRNGLNIIGFPVLFIRGGVSNYITDNDVVIIRKIFPYAEVETIENTGHWVHAEKPEEFLEIVKNFILS